MVSFSCAQMAYAAASTILLRRCLNASPLTFHTRCGRSAVANAVVDILPDGLVGMINSTMKMERSALRRSIQDAMRKDRTGNLRHTILWYANASYRAQEVCWPVDPDFTFGDFMSPFGALSALLVKKESIREPMPRRFTDLPPGYLNKSSIHIISSRSFDFYKANQLRCNFKYIGFMQLLGPTYPSLSATRELLDQWAGRSGRALFSLMREDWACTYGGGCRDEPETAPFSLPYKPDNYKRAIDEIFRLFSISKPFVITFGHVVPASTMYWIC
ncbi:hypothetical protein L249_7022 [Ophiocordyceps polyrhachis-furcata BCC 54312]|uniref:Uncharacterized protein n=1 Tax=Ophiocordyceps polyrhachis-furcata BCC 54312 TaxID=1330021 RepID=A0A367LKH8_9HYPO|nr:hypothetical protein L249_7022 [Ophiocordyceps polyrhachis-furcata BCC 54312]